MNSKCASPAAKVAGGLLIADTSRRFRIIRRCELALIRSFRVFRDAKRSCVCFMDENQAEVVMRFANVGEIRFFKAFRECVVRNLCLHKNARFRIVFLRKFSRFVFLLVYLWKKCFCLDYADENVLRLYTNFRESIIHGNQFPFCLLSLKSTIWIYLLLDHIL